MARKLIFTILIFSLASLELLVIRQGQIDTVYSMTQLHREINEQIAMLDAIRIDIEFACSPSVIANYYISKDPHDELE